MDTERNTPLHVIIWATPYGRKQAASVGIQLAQCRRARDFDVLVVRDWHVLARNPSGFRWWACEVLRAGARLYDAHSHTWIDGVDGRRFVTSSSPWFVPLMTRV